MLAAARARSRCGLRGVEREAVDRVLQVCLQWISRFLMRRLRSRGRTGERGAIEILRGRRVSQGTGGDAGEQERTCLSQSVSPGTLTMYRSCRSRSLL